MVDLFHLLNFCKRLTVLLIASSFIVVEVFEGVILQRTWPNYFFQFCVSEQKSQLFTSVTKSDFWTIFPVYELGIPLTHFNFTLKTIQVWKPWASYFLRQSNLLAAVKLFQRKVTQLFMFQSYSMLYQKVESENCYIKIYWHHLASTCTLIISSKNCNIHEDLHLSRLIKN